MENKVNTPFSRFESLGDNCEFGFFLRQSGNDISSFFRWTAILDFNKLNLLIKNELKHPFDFPDLKPLYEHMVINERHKIGFHSKMQSHVINDRRVFKKNGLTVRWLHFQESMKMKHLRAKFIHGLTEESRIYVVKGANSSEVLSDLSETISSFGDGKLLHIIQANDDSEIAGVKKINNNTYVGFIDCFADYNLADKISFDCWTKLIKNAEREIP